ncbi:2-hydroxychromene-2-carboxylate isomerase [Pseudothauera nasutitermitis]|uniref:2-hydroxychromene-2-carboxylate isomerase n=1 Tax=Pseudothauera nasutitermitis TaxID=2565930 RepID=A0A4S4AVJ4_9RHOO|nr:2-hydroxychromene-2-carboxylate isomerase [Pseudothauera nasutitermitis]THF64031.1 2-hydroxychromene-2-carboxylate isomerase [Pseudothauera nasutitermitis]
MAEPIDFYFDFSSPYGYFMAEKIDALAAAHGRAVRWRPFLLGAVYKQTGGGPMLAAELKGPYAYRDFDRTARFLGLPWTVPAVFPIGTQVAARTFYWLDERDPALARRFAQDVYRAYFAEGRDISQETLVLDIAAAAGADRAALAGALAGEAVRQRLKDECAQAIAHGVFGSPFVFVDGEPFWGVDRIPQIERWLETGGF